MTYDSLASSPPPRTLPEVSWSSSLPSQGTFSYHLWVTNPQMAKHRAEASPREGKVTGVFVLEGAVALLAHMTPRPHLERDKSVPTTPSLLLLPP